METGFTPRPAHQWTLRRSYEYDRDLSQVWGPQIKYNSGDIFILKKNKPLFTGNLSLTRCLYF